VLFIINHNNEYFQFLNILNVFNNVLFLFRCDGLRLANIESHWKSVDVTVSILVVYKLLHQTLNPYFNALYTDVIEVVFNFLTFTRKSVPDNIYV